VINPPKGVVVGAYAEAGYLPRHRLEVIDDRANVHHRYFIKACRN